MWGPSALICTVYLKMGSGFQWSSRRENWVSITGRCFVFFVFPFSFFGQIGDKTHSPEPVYHHQHPASQQLHVVHEPILTGNDTRRQVCFLSSGCVQLLPSGVQMEQSSEMWKQQRENLLFETTTQHVQQNMDQSFLGWPDINLPDVGQGEGQCGTSTVI